MYIQWIVYTLINRIYILNYVYIHTGVYTIEKYVHDSMCVYVLKKDNDIITRGLFILVVLHIHLHTHTHHT